MRKRKRNSSIRDIEPALKEFLKFCKKKFRDELVSIVLFGSYARGTAKKYSDIDLLVIVEKLPESVWDREKLLDEIVWKILKEMHIRISPILVERSEIEIHARWPNPLFYGIILGYRILFGSGYFERIVGMVKDRIREKKPIYIEEGRRWELIRMI